MGHDNYSKIRYLELVRQAEILKKKGVSLGEEDRDKYLELLNYEVELSNQIYWKNRKEYFSIMNNFINGKLTAEDFMDEFLCLWEKDQDTALIYCEPNRTAKGFADRMDQVFFCCEDFEPEAQENEQYGEKWLKDLVSNILIQIQKEYNFN